MEMLALPPVWSLSGSELLSTLDTLQAAATLLKTYELQILGRLNEMGTAKELGARDTVELVAERYLRDPVEVRKDLAFTTALHKYPAVTAALPDPADPARPAVVSPDQAKVIVKTLEKAPSTVPVEHLTVAEEQLVEAARLANPRELTRFGHKVLSTLDTDGPEPAEDQAHANRSLRLRRTDGGVKFSGFLPGADGEQLETQIHTLSKPHKTIDGERDPRTRDQRQADALTIVMNSAAGNPDHPGVPHLTVTIDFNDLAAATHAAFGGTADADASRAGAVGAAGAAGTDASGADASGADAVAGDTSRAGVVGAGAVEDGATGLDAGGRGGGVGELVFGGNLSAGAVRLLACDAAVLPIVLGGDSQPLDVGREQRFVNRYIRRALNKRDKGCVVCKAPPWMCHAHHLIHWAAGGPTSLQNLALLCAFHHRAVHDGQWSITIVDGIAQVTRPTWADPPRTDPAALAELVGWVTPAHTHNTTDDSTNPAGASSTSADWSGPRGVTSNPTHEQPERLPAASTLPNPTLAAAREALRTWLTAVAPNYTDPWGTNTTPTAGP
ncbi:HNH endonuclease signature motif containing protein [Kribbella yunnanensis]